MKLTIVTNAYNQGQFLRRCMESVLKQSYRNFEYIVIDPGSTDETPNILSEYESISDPRLIIIREVDNGPADGLNKGFARAIGSHYGYINADDFYLPDTLLRVTNKFKTHPNADCIFANGYIGNEKGELIRRAISTNFNAIDFVWGKSFVLQQSTFYKASSFHYIGGFNHYNHTSWDAELLLDMSLNGMKFIKLSEYWSVFVVHKDSITGSQKLANISKMNHERMFKKVMGRNRTKLDLRKIYFYSYISRIYNMKATIAKIIDKFYLKNLPSFSD